MKRVLKIVVPIIMAIAIVLSIGWYFFQYNAAFTRNLLLQSARKLEQDGRHDLAVWMYDLAYRHSSEDDAVAMELAQQFKAIGNYTKAEYTLTKAIEDGGSVQLYIALCKTYLEQDKLRDAVALLDNVTDPEIKTQLDDLRPAAPVADAPSGTYMQYITVGFSAQGKLYWSENGDYPSVLTTDSVATLTLPAGQTTLFAVAVAENGLVSPLAVYHYVVGNVVEEVVFADPAVEREVRYYLGVDDNYVIYSNQLWDITAFTVPSDAASCEDLRWMPNLCSLVIEYAPEGTMQILQQLPKLQTLSVASGYISGDDLQAIAALPGLTALALDDCALSNIQPLADCIGLTSLSLRGNAIRDLSALVNLRSLRVLDLSGNAVIQTDALCALPALEELDLSNNFLASTQALGNMTGLVRLDVSNNGLMRLEGLQTLVHLEEFAAADNNLIDVDALSGCLALKKLDVSGNTLLNIDVAATLTALEELDFSHNEVSVLPAFRTDCALRIIDGSYNALSSLNKLAGLENLTHIYMDYADMYNTKNSLSNIDYLTACPALKEVYVYGTKVRNVTKLADLGIWVQFTPA